jgi:hypothetical protein
MPTATHGGFDLAVELDQGFITELARLQLDLNIPPSSLGTNPNADPMTGEARVFPRLAYMWLNASPGFLRQRSADRVISIVLDLGAGAIEVKTVLNGDPPTPVSFDPPSKIPLEGEIEITDRVDARQLSVVLDRASPQNRTQAVCAVMDFNRDASTASEPGGADPKIDIRLNEYKILNAPLVILKRLDAQLNGFKKDGVVVIPPGVAAREAAEKELLNDIRMRLRSSVLDALTGTDSWQLPGQRGVVPLNIRAIAPGPTGAAALSVRTLSTSLLLLFRSTGPGGNAALVNRTQLAGTASGVTDSMALTISNSVLIAGIVRGALISSLPGLTAGDFAAGVPCFLARERVITPAPTPSDPSPVPFTLKSLVAGVDEANLVHIRGSIEQTRLGGGVTATASFDIAISILATTTVVAGVPTLTIVPTIVRSTVTRSAIFIAWWVYVLGGLTGGLIIVGLLAAIQLFGGGLVAGTVSAELGKISAPGTSGLGLPGGTRLTVSSTSINQSDAVAPTLTVQIPGGPFTFPMPFRDHDLVIALSRTALPSRLRVDCIVPDSADARRRLDAVGGLLLPSGGRWGLTIDEAIAAIQAQRLTLVVGFPPNEAVVEVVDEPGQIPYLRTQPDATGANNLLALPACP